MAKKSSRRPRKQQQSGPSTWESVWARQSEIRQHAVISILLVAVSLGFFAPVHFSSRQLIGGDTVHWSGMANAMLEYEQASGIKALWSPNPFGGMPGFLISYPLDVIQVDSAVSLLRQWIWPSSHMILLLLGVYLLTWYLSDNKFSGLYAAIAFGLTSYLPILLVAGHNSKFVALAWAPWMLLAFAYVLKKPSLKASLLFAVAVAVNLRAGHIQITYYASIVAGIWWVAEAIQAAKTKQYISFSKTTGYLVLASMMALLMVAQPYLAQWEYKQFSIRGAAAGGTSTGMSWEYAMAWSQGIGELFTLAVADAFGGGGALYWGPKTFTVGPHYFGALTIALAFVAVIRRHDITTKVFAAASLLMTLFALGDNLPLLNGFMFNHFPLFDAFRVPETWLSMVALTVAVLAGLGLSSILQKSDDRKMFKSALFTMGSLTGVLVLMMLAPNALMDFEKPSERAQIFQQVQAQNPGISQNDPRVQQVVSQEINRRKEGRVERFQADTRRSVLFLIAGLVILYLISNRKIPGWLGGMAFGVLILLDLGGVGRRYINENVLTDSQDAASEVPMYAFDRFILDRIEDAGGPGHLRVLSLEFGRDPNVNSRPAFYYETLGGYHGAKLQLYQDFLDQLLFHPTSFALNPNALSMMNVKYVVGRRAVPGYQMVFQDDATGNSVFENADFLPRAYFVSDVVRENDPGRIWELLQTPEFDISDSVILERDVSGESTPVDSTSLTAIRLQSHSPNEIVWSVDTDAPRWMVVSEVYYPAGWTASVDDAVVDIARANYLLRAVFVPAGKHTVRMTFNPLSHRMGVWVSGMATVFVYGTLLSLLVAGYFKNRGQKEQTWSTDE